MTIHDLHLNFKRGRDNLDSETYPDLPIEQVDYCLNVAAERFVKQRYGGNNVKRTSFEETQKRTDDISAVVGYSRLVPQGEDFFTGDDFKTERYKLPDDYWFAVVERVELYLIDCNKKIPADTCSLTREQILAYYKLKTVGVQARQHNQINTLLKDPFNKPEGEFVFRVMHDNRTIELFYDAKLFTGQYELGYIKVVKKLLKGVSYQNTDPSAPDFWKSTEYWLNSHTHQEIVDLAVKYSLELTESNRYQTNTGEFITQE